MANTLDNSRRPLQEALEPQLAVAARRYPQAVRLLTAYEEACDEADEARAQAAIETLQQLTGKAVAEADLFEYYEASSKEELAFQLSLPAPLVVAHITNAELAEIIRRLSEVPAPAPHWGALPFAEQVSLYYLADYYHNLLKLNFPTRYRFQYFGRFKGPDGRYHTLSPEEIAAKLLG
ncbi:MAG: hypothetical protein EOO62_00755 [Hymenobacter sp.]|nr:MAG: hypothetical protein EOO62_00755 [Hymenobacter sp.]